MPVKETSEWRALKDRAALLGDLLGMEVVFQEEVTRPAEVGYLRVTHLPNRSERQFHNGSDDEFRQGMLQILVALPKDKTVSVNRETAGRVANHFPADLRLSYGEVSLRIERRPDVGTTYSGKYHAETPVMVRYNGFY